MRLASLVVAFTLAGGDPYGDIGDFKVKNPEDKVDVASVPPTTGAIVLFNGKSLDEWTHRNGKPAMWKLLPGGVMQSKGGDLVTKQKFAGKYKLHVEFRVPITKGPDKGNSGVYLNGLYEIQILQSYGQKLKANSCGALYGIATPLVDACKAPTVWQSFDILYTAPICADGEKKTPGVATIFHNGIKIIDSAKITKNDTGSGLKINPCDPGPIMLQDYGDPIQFRNIWLLKQ